MHRDANAAQKERTAEGGHAVLTVELQIRRHSTVLKCHLLPEFRVWHAALLSSSPALQGEAELKRFSHLGFFSMKTEHRACVFRVFKGRVHSNQGSRCLIYI